MYERLKMYEGQAIAIICVRYTYRGIVSEVRHDCVTLRNCWAVEEAGPASGQKCKAEDKIPGELDISLAAIEIFFQPPWASAEMGTPANEKGTPAKKK